MTQPPAPGRRRTPPGHTRVPREELADGDGPLGPDRKRGPDAVRRRRWSAERRPHSSKESAARRKTGAPLGAPSPRLFRGATEGKTAYPAPQRIRVMTRA